MPGQITLETQFGKVLATLATEPSLSAFVEVGTWDGQGSTQCLVEGLRRRRAGKAHLRSFETNRQMLAIAHAAQASAQTEGLVSIEWGRLSERMLPLREILAHPKFQEVLAHFAVHYEQDIIDFYSAPHIKVDAADFVLLDGGEFSSYGDWLAVRHLEPKVVALDDTRAMKCERILRELREAGWSTLFESDERNGCVVLVNPRPTLRAA